MYAVPHGRACPAQPPGSAYRVGPDRVHRAQVYKAKRGGATDVACKVMRLDLLEGGAREQQLEAFMREAAVLKACRDQHILMFLGACLKARRALHAPIPCPFLSFLSRCFSCP